MARDAGKDPWAVDDSWAVSAQQQEDNEQKAIVNQVLFLRFIVSFYCRSSLFNYSFFVLSFFFD